MAGFLTNLRKEVRVDGCDTERLVAVSEQFNELELEFVRRHEVTARQLAEDKADWAKLGAEVGSIYQNLCDSNIQATVAALDNIKALLSRHGVLVPAPVIHRLDGATDESTYGEEGGSDDGE